MTNELIREGGCQCGAIRYRAVGEPVLAALCHCSSCRRASAAPTTAWAMYPQAQVTLYAGRTDDLCVVRRGAARILQPLRHTGLLHRELPARPHRHDDRQLRCARIVAADDPLLGFEAPALDALCRRPAALPRVSAAAVIDASARAPLRCLTARGSRQEPRRPPPQRSRVARSRDSTRSQSTRRRGHSRAPRLPDRAVR